LYKQAYVLVDLDAFAYGLSATIDVGRGLGATLKGFYTAAQIHGAEVRGASFEINAGIGFDWTAGSSNLSIGLGGSIVSWLRGSMEVESAWYKDSTLQRDYECRVILQQYPKGTIKHVDLGIVPEVPAEDPAVASTS
jgi:hypothetical protein